MGRIRFAASAAVLTWLAGCAAAPPPAPVVPVNVDGVYYGTSTRYRAEDRACPHPGLVTLAVAYHHFQFRWVYGTMVDATIGPDGVIHGNDDAIRLTGRVIGGKLEGDVSTPECGLHFTVFRHLPGAR